MEKKSAKLRKFCCDFGKSLQFTCCEKYVGRNRVSCLLSGVVCRQDLPFPRLAPGSPALALQLALEAAAPRAGRSPASLQLAILLALPDRFHYGHSWHAVIFLNWFWCLRCAHPKMALTPPQHPRTDVVANLDNERTGYDKLLRLHVHWIYYDRKLSVHISLLKLT